MFQDNSASIIIIYLLVLTFFSAALLGIALFYWRNAVQKSRYHQDKTEMELSDIRNYYEKKMSDLTERLTATEERWQEVNSLIISSQNLQDDVISEFDADEIPLFQELQIYGRDVSIDQDLVFVLTPFAHHEENTYLGIRAACKNLGFNCLRGDEEYVQGEILPHIIKLIAKARIVVANVSSRNPNVFYELGIAHTLGKATILVGKTVSDIPFDIRTKRVVTFTTPRQLSERLTTALTQATGRNVTHIGSPD